VVLDNGRGWMVLLYRLMMPFLFLVVAMEGDGFLTDILRNGVESI
jgi:hypothetical protein